MTRHRIEIHPDAPSKPEPGAPCNGCGVCCLAEPCPVGILVSRRRRGACAALQWDDARQCYRCGVLAARTPGSWPQAWARRVIGAGLGCDCDLQIEAAGETGPARSAGLLRLSGDAVPRPRHASGHCSPPPR